MEGWQPHPTCKHILFESHCFNSQETLCEIPISDPSQKIGRAGNIGITFHSETISWSWERASRLFFLIVNILLHLLYFFQLHYFYFLIEI